jgi:putative DNA primase/helicase
LWYAYYAEDVDYLRSLGFEVSDRKSLNPDGREVVIVYGVGDLYATGEVPDDVALCYGSGATAVRVVVTPNHRGKMLAELFATGGITADELRSWAENETVQPKPTRVESEHAGDSGTFGTPPPGDFWKKKGNPRPIRATLLPVPTLPGNLVPDPLYPWLSDIAERISCPLDFAVIPAIVALGCALGRKIGMRPKAHDVWTVIPNPWGAIIGRPGVLKSPPLKEALLPLRRLEVEAREIFERELTSYRGMLIVKEAEAKLAKQAIEKAVKASSPKELVVQMSEKLSDIIPPDAPVQRRYTTSDSTMEALGPLLAQHGHIGILRDELTGWFRSLERTDQGTAKAFFLELYDGLGELYQFDRIGRGYLPIKGGTGQVLGGIQPGPWRSLLRAILQDSSADDGLISRLSLLTWPDVAEWKHVDRWPDTTAKNTAFEIYQKLANLDPGNIGAKVDEYGSGMPYLHFDHEAQELFDVWHGNLEVRLRKGDESPLLESHLAKYRKLMPQMSFISYMVDVVANGLTGPVTSEHAVRGLQWCEYLEPHARRAYAIGSDQDIEPALALVEKIKAGALPSPFTSREVYRRHWSNLDDPRMTGCAITVLEEHNWLTIVEVKQERGASREDVYLHPDLPRKGS